MKKIALTTGAATAVFIAVVVIYSQRDDLNEGGIGTTTTHSDIDSNDSKVVFDTTTLPQPVDVPIILAQVE